MSRRARRSGRSRIVEAALVALAVAAIYLFIVAGGPLIVGQWLGPLFAPR